jgi:hypothetical protein
MNEGFKVTLNDIKLRKEQERLKREQEKTLKEAVGSTPGKLSRLVLMSNTVEAVRFLHKFEYGEDIYVHYRDGDKWCNKICEVHYGKDCSICGTHSSWGENYAIPVRCFIIYAYRLLGETFTKVDDRTGESKVYNLNPIRVVSIPTGSNDCNIIPLQTGSRLNFFTECVWLLEKKKGCKPSFQIPQVITSETELSQKLGKEVKFQLPESALKYSSMSKEDIFKYIISSFENVDYEALKLAIRKEDDLAHSSGMSGDNDLENLIMY